MRFNKWCWQVLLSMCVSAMAGVCAAEVKVVDAWVKLAPPTSSVNAAYMRLINEKNQTQTITNVSADCCGVAMLHHTRHEQDKVFMDHLAQLDIPAQTSVELKPGGLHMMLMKAHRPLLLNDPVVITLGFADGSEQHVNLMVKDDRR